MKPPELPIPDGETVDFAYQRIIEFGVIGCAFVVVFITFIVFVWWVMKSSAAQLKDMRDSERAAHISSKQTSDKMVEVNTKISERLNRVLAMLNSIAKRLSVQTGGNGDVSEDAP